MVICLGSAMLMSLCKWRHPKYRWELAAAVARCAASLGPAETPRCGSLAHLHKVGQAAACDQLAALQVCEGMECVVRDCRSKRSLSEPAALSNCLSSPDNWISNLNCSGWCEKPLEREVCAVEGMRLWQLCKTRGRCETSEHECDHRGPLLVRPDDCMRWHRRGESCSGLSGVGSDPGTQSMLCVTRGKNMTCQRRRSWSQVCTFSSLKGEVLFCNKIFRSAYSGLWCYLASYGYGINSGNSLLLL